MAGGLRVSTVEPFVEGYCFVQIRRRLGAWLAGVGSVGLMAVPSVAEAQSSTVVSRPVVQALPNANSQRLNGALARIARDPRDYSALIDAGDAANALGDAEAAAGFYKRADGIAPNNPRVKAGMARALVLQGKPTEAIPLFASAEAGGAADDVTSDRGLAYDLVGDTATAQRYYQAALARRDDDEVRRRLGISMAIAGDVAGSDAMLMPLLRKQDKPAWRAHAFALAIAGKTKEAVETVNAILPAPLAQSVTPYLRYMPRLTRPQQAAAVNLGKFPRASEIGRDDPVIAAYAASKTRLASADQALVPRGKPLGGGRRATGTSDTATAPALTGRERRERDKAARLARAEAVQAARIAPPDPTAAIGRDDGGELPALASSAPMGMPAQTVASASRTTLPTPTPTPTPTLARAPATSASSPATQSRLAVADTRTAGTTVVRTGTLQLPPMSSPERTPAQAAVPAPAAIASQQQRPVEVARAMPAASATPRPTAPGFDLANLGAAPTRSGAPAAAATPPPAALPQPAAAELDAAAVSLEQAFADLGAPSRAAAPIAGAVDVRAIEPAKPQPPVLAKPEAKPEATGKQTATEATDVDAPVPATKKATTRQARLAEAKLAAAAKLADAKSADSEEVAGKKGEAKAGSDKKANGKAVDPKKGDPKKGAAKTADAKKAVPSHPSRIWVQVGVGRDKAAIAYDWRKFVKQDPALFKSRQPYISDMGRTNRILAGPFETQKAASDLLAKLKKADFGGAFVWTSPAGQMVDPLPVK
jgi:tetratricopeptide (TPR) repeat protein